MTAARYDEFAEAYLTRHLTFLSTLPTKTIGYAAEALWSAHERGATIFLCGNGGGAALAAHFAADLNKNTIMPQQLAQARRFKAIALTENSALISGWGNTLGYEHIFAEQLRNLAEPNDVLIAISSSGTSPNILAAVTAAAEIGLTTIGMTGLTGGRLRSDCDICIAVDSDVYEHNEPLHSVVSHLLTFYLRQRLYAQTAGEE